MSAFRLAEGGRVDRGRPLRFTFDGRELCGFAGDTLASALLAEGVHTVARSIRYGRPRGVFSAGVEEPTALVQIEGACAEPMVTAPSIELFDGLQARGLAGRGRLEPAGEDGFSDGFHWHCDVLVVGGGAAGLAAALAAGRSGARVLLADEQAELGGALLATRRLLGGAPAANWVAGAVAELEALTEVRLLPRTTVLGLHDHNHAVAVERRTDHLGADAPAHLSRRRVWHIRARQVVLATGAHERPIAFAGNDLPGVMLAGAARTYVNRYAVAPGRRAVVFTTNDSAYEAALDLADSGVAVAAVVDARDRAPAAWAEGCRERGIDVLAGSAVTAIGGDTYVESAEVASLDATGGVDGARRAVACDLLLVSGGWNPVVHLFRHLQGPTRFDDALGAFVPAGGLQGVEVAGAARGVQGLGACLEDGARLGALAAERVGLGAERPAVPAVDDPPVEAPRTLWLVPGEGDAHGWTTHFVDLQRDATVADIHRATGAGMRSVEHIKRYTTIGTAHDQGKTSGVLAVGIVAHALGAAVADLGTTTHRPPYTPVTFAALAGRDRGPVLHDPVRVTPIHPWHVAQGAAFEDVGQWKRPWYFPRDGEDLEAAVDRECSAARERVAMMDASTLGKIDVHGRDAAELLDRIYTNLMSSVKPGAIRYGLMCRPDGMVFDDGTAIRLAEDRYLVTTTTGNAAAVLDWLEEWLQTEWPELRVHCTSVTDQWATIAMPGPRSREVLSRVAPGLDVSNDAFPFMTWRDTTVAGIEARVCRISFSGELAYEVNVPAWHGLALWEALLAAGEDEGITPYGTETMHVLRAEKGYPIIGQDTDGTVTPQDLGMDWIVSKKKRDFIGMRSFARPDTSRADRKQLVGLLPADPEELLPEGAQLVEAGAGGPPPVPMLGHVTSSYRSAALGRTFALALVKSGRERIGRTLDVPLGDRTVSVLVADPVLYDRDGARRDG
jgi:sarcosine oxidase subunit alpha